MLRTLTIVLALTSVTTLAYAQSAAIGQRKEILKGWGNLAKEPGDMLKGDAKFDLAKVQALLTSLKEGAPKLRPFFPLTARRAKPARYLQFGKRMPISWAALTRLPLMPQQQRPPLRMKRASKPNSPKSSAIAVAAIVNTAAHNKF